MIKFLTKIPMKTSRLLGFTTLFLFIISCGNNKTGNDQTKIPDGWNLLSENGYSIQYPADWVLNKSGQSGTSFGLITKHTSDEDLFSENVNLIIQDLSELKYDLDKFTDVSEEQIRTMVTNSNLLESSRQNSNGLEFQKIIYTGDFGTFNLTIEQYYLIKNNKAYVLTLTCETPRFEAYKETGEKILNTFRLQ